MIVCHCNRIDHTEIERATSELVSQDPIRLVTPGCVYRALGKRPRCGGCMPLATSLIYAHLESRVDPCRECPMSVLALANEDTAVSETMDAAE